MYFSRRQRNPFYQSAEDLIDRGNPIWTKSHSTEENGGYEVLRTLPLSKGKSLQLINGFHYCQSPTDPPLALRPVPSPRRVTHDNSTYYENSELVTTLEKADGKGKRERPRKVYFDQQLLPDASQKDSPIYELPDVFLHSGLRLKQHAHSTPPALPEQESLQMSTKGATLAGPAQLPPGLVIVENKHALVTVENHTGEVSAAGERTTYQNIDSKPNNQQKSKGDEREIAVELKESISAGKVTLSPEETAALYSTVKKFPRGKATAVGSGKRQRECVDESDLEPPEVPPYSGEDGADTGKREEREAVIGDNGHSPSTTPFIQ